MCVTPAGSSPREIIALPLSCKATRKRSTGTSFSTSPNARAEPGCSESMIGSMGRRKPSASPTLNVALKFGVAGVSLMMHQLIGP